MFRPKFIPGALALRFSQLPMVYAMFLLSPTICVISLGWVKSRHGLALRFPAQNVEPSPAFLNRSEPSKPSGRDQQGRGVETEALTGTSPGREIWSRGSSHLTGVTAARTLQTLALLTPSPGRSNTSLGERKGEHFWVKLVSGTLTLAFTPSHWNVSARVKKNPQNNGTRRENYAT